MNRENHEISRQFDSIIKNERALINSDLELAEAEYFADMAFDKRLYDITQQTAPTILANLHHETTKHTAGLAGKYLKSNELTETEMLFDDGSVEKIREPAFSYYLHGTVARSDKGLAIDATIMPDDESKTTVRITSSNTTPDSYAITSTDDGELRDFDIINTEDVYTILSQLSSTTDRILIDKHLDDLHKIPGYNQSVLYEPIEKMWSIMAESHGDKETIYHLSHVLENPYEAENPETIDLYYIDKETKDSSQVQFTLMHTVNYAAYETKMSHRLNMLFELPNDERLIQEGPIKPAQSDANKLNQEAAKIVHSNGARLTGLTVTQELRGRITPLDLDMADVKKMFVNWFDELINSTELTYTTDE